MAAKRARKNRKDVVKRRQSDHEIWMLRLKVGSVYLLVWLIVTAWVTNHLPDPINAAKFYADSKAHWFIHLGLAIMFVIILTVLGKRQDDGEEHEST